jgi:hypothetical protein
MDWIPGAEPQSEWARMQSALLTGFKGSNSGFTGSNRATMQLSIQLSLRPRLSLKDGNASQLYLWLLSLTCATSTGTE